MPACKIVRAVAPFIFRDLQADLALADPLLITSYVVSDIPRSDH